MIETVSSATAPPARPQKKAASGEPAPLSFSLAAAGAALEGRASAALKAFGGMRAAGPAAALTAGVGPERNAAPSRRPATPDAPHRAASQGRETKETLEPTAPVAAQPAQNARDGAASAQPSPTVGSAAAAAPAALAAQSLNSQNMKSAGVAVHEPAQARAAKSERASRAAPAREPDPAPQDFARLLARRLGAGATEFDVRLDPPELGRVRARLFVTEDGKAALAVKFDNQAAFDLFARDEAALRAALAAAGFDLAQGDLAFTFERGGAEPPQITAGRAIAPTFAAAAIDPAAETAFSRGVVDLRI